MKTMKLTALIPVYNDDYALAFCLGSIVDHFDEIIVLDDASTDDTPDVAADFARRYRHVSFVRHEGKQLGWIEARNKLLALTGSDYLFWLDSDDVLCEYEAGRLKHCAEAYGMVRFKLTELWGDFNHTTQRLRHSDPCHLFLNRRARPHAHWAGGSAAKLVDCGVRTPGSFVPHFFHIKGVKPDCRLVERQMMRKWLRSGRQGALSVDDLTGEEIHKRAMKMLLHSRQDRLIRTYPDNGNAPRRPAVIEAEVKAGQRFEIIYTDGRPVDRLDRGSLINLKERHCIW